MPALNTRNLFANVARMAAAPYLRRCPWVDRRELEQVAWEAMLDALPRHDGVRSVPAFLFGAARNAVHRYAWRTGAATHVTTRNAGSLPGDVRRAQAAAVDVDDAVGMQAPDARPDDAAAGRDLRERIAQRCAELLADDLERELVREVLLGDGTAASVARRRALEPRRVQETLMHVRERLATDARLSVLYAQLVGR